ncbi:MAG: hypothetical protein R3C11_00700 [Planctomycetaceae bacterium]
MLRLCKEFETTGIGLVLFSMTPGFVTYLSNKLVAACCSNLADYR